MVALMCYNRRPPIKTAMYRFRVSIPRSDTQVRPPNISYSIYLDAPDESCIGYVLQTGFHTSQVTYSPQNG